MNQPILLLTRPEAQSRRVLADVQDAMGVEVACLISPVQEIETREVAVKLDGYAGLILTSVNGVAAAPDLTGRRVHCVGARTGEAAADRGADVGVVALDAARLVERILETGVPAPLLHLRGEHARGEIAQTLSSAGIETHEAVVYAQQAVAMGADALRLIRGDGPLVLPLYSPRSARLVGQAARPGPQVHVIALSQAVAQEYAAVTGQDAEICESPEGHVMIERIAAALRGEIA
jgi:uroporphyrinogen-III synthase